MYKYIAILITSLLLVNISMAQPGRGKGQSGKNLQIANDLLAQSSYYNAITYIEKALSQDPGNISTAYLLADTYRKARDYDNASDYYGLIINSDDPAVYLNYPLIRLHHANMLKQNKKYRKAIEAYKSFMSTYNGQDSDLYIEKASTEITGCELAMSGAKSMEPMSVRAMNGNMNSGYTDYAPMPIGDSLLIFSSLRSKQLINTGAGSYAKSKIYMAERISGSRWTKAKPMPGPFNNSTDHVGHGAYSPDGKRFYYTICPTEENHQVKCRIVVSESNEDGIWGKGNSIRQINIAGHKSSTPIITRDMRGTERIYFSSDRPGGRGGMDIWSVARQKDGSYTPALNAEELNTQFNEVTPFFDGGENTFYFSSNGYAGLGGYDVFKVSLAGNQWGEVENVGKPINSQADDMYYTRTESRKYGFLVSNRSNNSGVDNKTCCDNIYRILFGVEEEPEPEPEPEPEVPTTQLAVSGFVFATTDVSIMEMDGAKVRLFDEIKGNPKLVGEQSSSVTEGFSFKLQANKSYTITVLKDGFLEEKIKFNTKKVAGSKTYRKDIYLLEKGVNIEGMVYTEDEQGELTPYAGADIEVLKKQEAGAEEIVKQLKSTKDGYKIFLKTGAEYKVKTSIEDYLTSSYEVDTRGVEVAIQNKQDVVLKSKVAGKTYKIENIYYDYNSAKLRKDSYEPLNELIQMLADNPNITIEIGAHTDSIGEEDYNQKLSLRRAESVVTYLREAGVLPTRLTSKGYGEGFPIAPNDTDENRQLNRRTEFKIIGVGN